MKRYLLTCVAWLLTATLFAQQDTLLIRTVVVENTYNPAIMDANKINIMPTIEQPTVQKQTIAYRLTASPYQALPRYAMQNLAINPTQPDATRGWGNVGYGNYGNLALKLGYLASFTAQDHLYFALGTDGMAGKIKNSNFEAWKSRFYNTDLNLHYTHTIGTLAFGAKANVTQQTFNYALPTGSESDNQNHTVADLSLYFNNNNPSDVWQYGVALGYANFNQSYQKSMVAFEGNGLSESKFHVKAHGSYRLDNNSVLGLTFGYENYSYTDRDIHVDSICNFAQHGELLFNPYYTYEHNGVQLHLGAKINGALGYDNGLHIAPDIFVGFPFADTYMFYIEGKGGVRENNFAQLNALTPYWQITSELKDTYVPLASTVGFKASPAAGFNLHIFGGFQITKNDLLVNSGQTGVNLLTNANTEHIHMGLSAQYAYKHYLNLTAKATYTLWDCDNDVKPLLYTKPTFEGLLKAKGEIEKATWELGYQYTARYKGQMDAINNLFLTVSYALPKDVTVWVKADNLLNQSYQHYWSIPSEKLNVMLGASICF